MFEILPRPEWIIEIKKLVISNQVGDWCKLPYPGHKKGCPNYGKTDRCPPNAPHVSVYFDLSKPLYFIHSEFDLKTHEKKMKVGHPGWSNRQCRCLLYWQGSSRKQMNQRVYSAIDILGTNRHTTCPEAMGVNVFVTAKNSGLTLDKTRHINTARHITLMGYKRNK